MLCLKGFKVKKAGGKKCIQFTDTQDGSKYSLKVTNASNVAFEVRRKTQKSIANIDMRLSLLYYGLPESF